MKKQTIPKDSPLSRVVASRTGNWLKAAVDDYLEKPQKHRKHKDDWYEAGWFHPSSLGNPCDAMMAFDYMGLEGKGFIRARTRKIFDLGTARDEDVKRYLHESGISVMKHWGGSPAERKKAGIERRIEIPHITMRGEFDDKVKNPLSGEIQIFEMKTMNRDEWQELREPKPEHILQAHCYMMGTGVFSCIFTYECKNCQDWKCYTIKFDPKVWQGIEIRLTNIMNLVQQKIVPNRVPMQNDSNCAYYHLCGSFEYA